MSTTLDAKVDSNDGMATIHPGLQGIHKTLIRVDVCSLNATHASVIKVFVSIAKTLRPTIRNDAIRPRSLIGEMASPKQGLPMLRHYGSDGVCSDPYISTAAVPIHEIQAILCMEANTNDEL